MTTLAAVHDFLIHEARLLDSGRFAEWAQLYTDDAVYWAPVDRAQTRPLDAPSHILDDKQLMMARAERLQTPRMISPEPGARTLHCITNVAFEDLGEVRADYRVASNMLCVEFRDRGYGEADQRILAASVSHGLRMEEDGSFRIAWKRVDLVNAAAPFNALSAPL